MNKKSFNLPDQSYWDKSYHNLELQIVSEQDKVRQWIERFFDKAEGDCLEIGCFPGRYLAVFGKLGYRLYGVDLTPRVEQDLPCWLKDCGYKVGEFCKLNFEDFKSKKQYDIVCSFGFIEHFIDWQEILKKHALFVKNEGYLVISAPNFRGLIQRALHILLDRKNYNRHYIPSMNTDLWQDIVQNIGFDVVYCGYFGAFDFWVDNQSRNILQMMILKLINRLSPVLKKLPKDKMIYAPFCGLIAKKRTLN